MDNKDVDYKSFKLTIETLNPAYKVGPDNGKKLVSYGSNFLAVMTTGPDTFAYASNGHEHKLKSIENLINGFNNDGSIPLLLISASALLTMDGWKAEDILRMLNAGIEAAQCANDAEEKRREGPTDE